jgi:hypothetical protein
MNQKTGTEYQSGGGFFSEGFSLFIPLESVRIFGFRSSSIGLLRDIMDTDYNRSRIRIKVDGLEMSQESVKKKRNKGEKFNCEMVLEF